MAGIKKMLCLALCALFMFSCAAFAEEDIDVEDIILNPEQMTKPGIAGKKLLHSN